MSDSDDLAARVADLRQQIAYHNERYHTLDSPEIADADFDLLVRELLKLETEHPELVSADSPTAKVGGAPLSGHLRPVIACDEQSDNAWTRRAAHGERVARGIAGHRHVRVRVEERCLR